MKYIEELKKLAADKALPVQVYTQACELYPTLRQGDYVLDFSHDLALIQEGGRYQIVWKDSVLDTDSPVEQLSHLLQQEVL